MSAWSGDVEGVPLDPLNGTFDLAYDPFTSQGSCTWAADLGNGYSYTMTYDFAFDRWILTVVIPLGGWALAFYADFDAAGIASALVFTQQDLPIFEQGPTEIDAVPFDACVTVPPTEITDHAGVPITTEDGLPIQTES